jgi:hypothetical protein
MCAGIQSLKNTFPDETNVLIFLAKCNDKTNLNGACKEVYTSDRIIYRYEPTRNNGGGTCHSPDNCINCQDGFYGYGGKCLSKYSTINILY